MLVCIAVCRSVCLHSYLNSVCVYLYTSQSILLWYPVFCTASMLTNAIVVVCLYYLWSYCSYCMACVDRSLQRDQQIRRPHRSGKRSHDREINKLLAAAESGDINLVSFLLDWGNPLKSTGPPPELCHPFCQCKKCSPFTQAALNVNSHDSDGLTALHKASMHGRKAMCEELISHGASVNVKSISKSLTPLHYACIYRREQIVGVLLQAEVDLSVQDCHGNTPLHSCAISGNLSSAQILIDNEADINAIDFKGNTPLHNATRWAHIEIVKLFLTRGADYSIQNAEGQLAYSLCKDDEVKEAFASLMTD